MTKNLRNQSSKSFDKNSKIKNNLDKVKHQILIMSGKGGVGKSTVAVNLALSLSMQENDVGLLDLDISGPNIPKMLNIEDAMLLRDTNGIIPITLSSHLKVMSIAFLLKDKYTPVAWRVPLKMRVIEQFLGEVIWGKLDYLVIDFPSGTGDDTLSITQLIPNSSKVIIVTTSQDIALQDSKRVVNFAKTLNMPVIGIIENMSGFICPKCGYRTDLFKTGGARRAASMLSVHFLGEVPFEPIIVETSDSGRPFVKEHSKSDLAKTFGEIVNKIEKFVNGGETNVQRTR